MTSPNDEGLSAQVTQLAAQVAALEAQLKSHQHTGTIFSRTNLDRLAGLFGTVTTVPTGTPTSAYAQVKIYNNSGAISLYVYDVVSHTWNQIGGGSSGGIYAGYVNSDGTAGSFFPSGFTSAHNGTGSYTITHHLGTTNYSIAPCPASSNIFFSFTPSTNSVNIEMYDSSSGANADSPFGFILTTA